MLKIRVIPLLLLQDGLLKKPVQFRNPRTVADPITIVKVFENRQVDELILLDIARTTDRDEVDSGLIRRISQELSVPFAFGGGVRSLEEMRLIVQSGAEKIVINTSAVEKPTLISEAANLFGSQCVVVSIDVKHNGTYYEVYTRSGTHATGIDGVRWAREAQDHGAGEILINSIVHDGELKGYNIELISAVSAAVGIPVIAAGGASNLEDFVNAVRVGGASAVAAGSIYHYTKTTPNMVKGALHSAGIRVRMFDDIDYSFKY